MSSYEVTRSTAVAAEPDQIRALIEDLHQWKAWSPWEDLDPEVQRTYSGPDSGVGAHYAWKGNRKAGEGWMEITGCTPQRVDLDLAFMKPFESASKVTFLLEPHDASTDVTWRMTGEQKGLMSVVGKVFSMDRLIGKDFEKGLARLKAVAEA